MALVIGLAENVITLALGEAAAGWPVVGDLVASVPIRELSHGGGEEKGG